MAFFITRISALGIFALLFFSPLGVYALTVGPVKFSISLEPGGAFEEKIILFNETENEVELHADVANVTFAPGEKGVPIPAGIYGPDSLANWVTIAQSAVVLKPNERKEIPFRIALPDTATPGGYYAQIAWSPVVQVGSEINAIEKIASLILLRVEGDVQESALVSYLGSEKGHNRFEKMPVPLTVRINNAGTVHVAPTGEIRILDYRGKIVEKFSFNQGGNQIAYILPGETRSFNLEWKGGFRFGKYTAVFDAMYGESLQAVHAEYTFWIIPTYLLFAWLVVAVLVIILCIGLLKKCISLSRRHV